MHGARRRDLHPDDGQRRGSPTARIATNKSGKGVLAADMETTAMMAVAMRRKAEFAGNILPEPSLNRKGFFLNRNYIVTESKTFHQLF